MPKMHRDGSFDEEELVREGGAFVSRGGGREVGPEDDDRVSTDWVEDPSADDGVPGTRDDLPYDYGVEIPPATDHLVMDRDRRDAGFGDVGRTGPADEDHDIAPGLPEERELWDRQRALIEESEAEEAHLRGLAEKDLAAVVDAEAEGAADVLPDSPEGESATGSVTRPDEAL